MKIQRMSIWLMPVFLLALVALAVPADAQFTTGGDTVENAKPTGDTFPRAAGEMSVQWVNDEGGDTQYSDTATSLTTEVDTGFDITNISDSAGSDTWNVAKNSVAQGGPANGDDTHVVNVTTGDSVVHAFQVENRSNNPGMIPFRVFHDTNGITQSDSVSVELFFENGANTAASFDSAAANRIADNDTDELMFTQDEVKTVYAVQTIKSSAQNGDTVESRFFVSDQVDPALGDAATPGDQWEDGRSLASGTEDNNDTQTLWMQASVAGPVLDISKSLQSLTTLDGTQKFRPGDTVEFTITVTNTGGDTAHDVIVSDAMPDSTTYVVNSSTGSNTLNGNSTLVGTRHYDSAATDENQTGDGESTNTEKVAWELDTLSSDAGDNTASLVFQVTID